MMKTIQKSTLYVVAINWFIYIFTSAIFGQPNPIHWSIFNTLTGKIISVIFEALIVYFSIKSAKEVINDQKI